MKIRMFISLLLIGYISLIAMSCEKDSIDYDPNAPILGTWLLKDINGHNDNLAFYRIKFIGNGKASFSYSYQDKSKNIIASWNLQ